MEYSFNAEIAKKYGVDEAVFIHNLYWWIAKNEANGRHFHDGHSWTYNSMEAFAKLFPFWTVKQIRRIIQKLEDSGALLIGNYNEKPFDRTRWYALTEDVNSIYQKGTIDVPKRADHNCPNGQISTAHLGRPIPDNKPDSKPDNILPVAEAPDTTAEEMVARLPLNTGDEYPITRSQAEEWGGLYPAVDVMQELRKMRGWLAANPAKRKTARGILRFANGWLAREQDKGRTTQEEEWNQLE